MRGGKNGEWVRKSEAHRCKKPETDYRPPGTGVGSIWRCDCGRQWYLLRDPETRWRLAWATDHFPMRTYKQ